MVWNCHRLRGVALLIRPCKRVSERGWIDSGRKSLLFLLFSCRGEEHRLGNRRESEV